MNYYNDIEKSAVGWLKALIEAKLIPDGIVDDRSIAEVKPDDLKGFTQCHFFAGIGGWPYALQLAAWPSTRPVWTGSCPCQPLSVAGKGKAEKDERHLWPEFKRLIGDGKPPAVFGEQVASKDGRQWLSGIRLDLEAMDYAVGAADLCSPSVCSPNIRQRLFWVADAETSERWGLRKEHSWRWTPEVGGSGGSFGWVGVSEQSGPQGLLRSRNMELQGATRQERPTPETGFWDRYNIINCRDGKQRRIPTESALFPLAPRIPGRVGLLRGAGNAINPWVAAEFIKAFMEVQTATQ